MAKIQRIDIEKILMYFSYLSNFLLIMNGKMKIHVIIPEKNVIDVINGKVLIMNMPTDSHQAI